MFIALNKIRRYEIKSCEKRPLPESFFLGNTSGRHDDQSLMPAKKTAGFGVVELRVFQGQFECKSLIVIAFTPESARFNKNLIMPLQ
jgi:hypothetical protein